MLAVSQSGDWQRYRFDPSQSSITPRQSEGREGPGGMEREGERMEKERAKMEREDGDRERE